MLLDRFFVAPLLRGASVLSIVLLDRFFVAALLRGDSVLSIVLLDVSFVVVLLVVVFASLATAISFAGRARRTRLP